MVSWVLATLDSVTYNALSEDTSWGRIPDGMPLWRKFTTPSPGKSNVVSTIDLQKAQQTDILLFPNPSTYYVNVHIKSDEHLSHRLTIYSLSGAILITEEFFGSKHTIDLSDLPPSIYIVGIEEKPRLRIKLIVL